MLMQGMTCMIKFTSYHKWSEDSATHQILSKKWALTNIKEMRTFFDLQQSAFIEYSDRFNELHKPHADAIKIMNQRRINRYLPDEFYSNANQNKIQGFSKSDLNNCVLWEDKNKPTTIVIINNHASWQEALYGNIHGTNKQNGSDLHYYAWLTRNVHWLKKSDQFNLISITEDLRRIEKNPLVYPSYFMDGISDKLNTVEKMATYIKSIFDTEFIVYNTCKNAMVGALLAEQLNAKGCFIEDGSTSFVSDNKFTEWKFDGDTVVFDYAVDNVYFLSWLREVYFDIVNKTNTKNIKEVMLRTPKTLWGYYSVAGIEDQDYFTPWRKYLEKDKKKIKNLEFNLLKDSNMFDMQKHIRKSFYSFVNRF